MHVDQFTFELPKHKIAQKPLENKDQAKLLVLRKETGQVSHHIMADLPDLLGPEFHIILNDSRVVPSTLALESSEDSQHSSVSFGYQPKQQKWTPLGSAEESANPHRSGQYSEKEQWKARVKEEVQKETSKHASGVIEPSELSAEIEMLLQRKGRVTYPRYLKHLRKEYPVGVPDFYNNAYASHPGSIAPPSGGINVSNDILRSLKEQEVGISNLTLHVGHVTFKRPKVQDLNLHKMGAEYFHIAQDTAAEIRKAQINGKKLLAIGTTSTRTLEHIAKQISLQQEDVTKQIVLENQAYEGMADIFIKPGHRFRMVDALLTGFHGPRTTLFMLICALGGIEAVKDAYQEALQLDYRWYTLGDSMLIL